MSGETGPVLHSIDDGLLLITINRPEARNAVNEAVAQGVARLLDAFDARHDLRVAILTGAGGHFCAGMDLKAFLAGESPMVGERGLAGLTGRPPRKPIIAAVEGYALAGGFELALACDLIVAAENAQFGLPEAKRGLTASAGGLLRLPRQMPYRIALELALTGDMLAVADAERFGLVNRVVPAGGTLDAARTLARAIIANAPLSVEASKRVVAESVDWSVAEMFQRQSVITAPISRSDDAREGARAFAEKRAPEWKGR